jgi:hypothetical protein
MKHSKEKNTIWIWNNNNNYNNNNNNNNELWDVKTKNKQQVVMNNSCKNRKATHTRTEEKPAVSNIELGSVKPKHMLSNMWHTHSIQHCENIQTNEAYKDDNNITMASVRTMLNNTQNMDAAGGKQHEKT